MGNLATVEVKAFVPARDFDLSKRFYRDLGFVEAWSSDDLAYFHAGQSSFLLQRFYRCEHAENFMMHLLVEDVAAWWHHVETEVPPLVFLQARLESGLMEGRTE